MFEIIRKTVPAALNSCRGLRNCQRQVAESLGNGVRRLAVGLIRAVEQHSDRLLALEASHADMHQAGLIPIRSSRRGQDSQPLPTRDEVGQIVGTIEIVQDDEPVRPFRRRQRLKAPPRGILGGVLSFAVDAEPSAEAGQPRDEGPAGLRADPGDERPALRLAAGRDGGGEL